MTTHTDEVVQDPVHVHPDIGMTLNMITDVIDQGHPDIGMTLSVITDVTDQGHLFSVDHGSDAAAAAPDVIEDQTLLIQVTNTTAAVPETIVEGGILTLQHQVFGPIHRTGGLAELILGLRRAVLIMLPSIDPILHVIILHVILLSRTIDPVLHVTLQQVILSNGMMVSLHTALHIILLPKVTVVGVILPLFLMKRMQASIRHVLHADPHTPTPLGRVARTTHTPADGLLKRPLLFR